MPTDLAVLKWFAMALSSPAPEESAYSESERARARARVPVRASWILSRGDVAATLTWAVRHALVAMVLDKGKDADASASASALAGDGFGRPAGSGWSEEEAALAVFATAAARAAKVGEEMDDIDDEEREVRFVVPAMRAAVAAAAAAGPGGGLGPGAVLDAKGLCALAVSLRGRQGSIVIVDPPAPVSSTSAVARNGNEGAGATGLALSTLRSAREVAAYALTGGNLTLKVQHLTYAFCDAFRLLCVSTCLGH